MDSAGLSALEAAFQSIFSWKASRKTANPICHFPVHVRFQSIFSWKASRKSLAGECLNDLDNVSIHIQLEGK